MALQTATFQSTKTKGFTLVLELTENSVSTSDNTSNISYVLKLTSGGYDFAGYPIGYTITLNGTVVASLSRSDSPQKSLSTNSSLTLASGTTNVTHNSDGKLDMEVSAKTDMASSSYTPGSQSLSGTMTLTEIARGIVYIGNGSTFDKYQCYIGNGTGWDLYIPYIGNGSTWEQYSG